MFSDLINDHIEKCSESNGTKFVLCFFSNFLINFHPQIIDSLFAIPKFSVYLMVFNVGSNPSMPEIPLTVK